mmetsp:Transcript_30028/g.52715  ORF Transcript_30028/g.52715 Transcript_30028/m.52715 type:complete len:392 (+) Transcript_30028:44-1219(+)
MTDYKKWDKFCADLSSDTEDSDSGMEVDEGKENDNRGRSNADTTSSSSSSSSKKKGKKNSTGECTRCGQDASKGICRIPHPALYRQDCGATFGGGGMSQFYSCGACGQSYTEFKKNLETKDITIKGAKWCYEGPHTLDDLKDDKRKIDRNAVTLMVGPNLQKEIDELPTKYPKLKELVIRMGMCYDDKIQPSLDVKLPHLVTLDCDGVCFAKLVLNAQRTPILRKVRLKNVPDDCELEIVLPTLLDFSIQFWRGDSKIINDMLKAAKNLIRFDSYKLWVDELHFASNRLLEIDLHRSDSLQEISIWAPYLRALGLQACYSLNRIKILKNHRLKKHLPKNYKESVFEVQTRNAVLSKEAAADLKRNPRVKFGGFAHAGMPTEGMFADMNSYM